ncbi:MAG: DUF3737 family protein [Bacilli bacterium]|nr:DUF3737 family protein [Bacilli bacterium]
MKLVANKVFDEERALYGIQDTEVKNVLFAGPADGESVLKETRNIIINGCNFSLRYPVWHAHKYQMINSNMDEKTRAPIWYSNDGVIKNSVINGVKAVRECQNTYIENCQIKSTEFGWKTKNTEIKNSEIVSEYIFLESRDIKLNHVRFSGKYSFQYVENLEINDSELNTKDAFWHSKNVTVKNSIVKGEYLAWFSDGLTLINCKIIGTQPLCYCKNLKLINCEMIDCDLSFEYSDVDADIVGHVDSIKNPHSGVIRVESVGEIIYEDAVMPTNGKVIIK